MERLDGMEQFDIIASDVNMAPLLAVEMISKVAKYLKKGGYIVFTLKLHDKLKNKRANCIEKCRESLSMDFEQFELLWLLANTGLERTLIAKKKNGKGESNLENKEEENEEIGKEIGSSDE